MELTHEFTVPAPIQQTWDALNDIESVALCFPGAVVTSVDGDSFAGSCKVKLGPVALVYNGSGTFVEKDVSTHTMKVEAKGKDKRGNGTAGAHVGVAMFDTGGQTRVEIVTDLAITGKPAQFGRGVMQEVSNKLLRQFVECLQTKVGIETAPTEDAKPIAGMVPAGSAPQGAPGGPDTAPSAVSAPHASRGGEAEQNDALDLGGAVLPVLAKAYWKPALAAVAVIGVIVYLASRGRSV
ncbi:MAG: SRPBCC family protein [Actinomycetota bacterium]|nr:SRPBCC family protein [Actinomycetota bacterium]